MSLIKNIILNTLLVLFSIVITLLSIGIYIELLIPKHAYQSENNVDMRSKREVLRDFESENITAYPAIFPQLFVKNSGLNGIFPLSGISNSLSVHCNESGKWAIFTSDRYGFNNIDSIYNNPIDTVLIGDSFAQGACVEQNETISAHMNKGGIKTISLGMEDNDPVIEFATLLEYTPFLKPKNIVWLYYEGNDLRGVPEEMQVEILQKYLNNVNFSQDLAQNQNNIDDMLKEFIEKYDDNKNKYSNIITSVKKIITFYFLRQMIENAFPSPNKNKKIIYDESFKIFKDIITKANKFAKANNQNFYFVYLPQFARYNGNKIDLDYKAQVTSFIHDQNITMIDFDVTLRNLEDPLSIFPYRKNGHYTGNGYKLVSDIITKTIYESK